MPGEVWIQALLSLTAGFPASLASENSNNLVWDDARELEL